MEAKHHLGTIPRDQMLGQPAQMEILKTGTGKWGTRA